MAQTSDREYESSEEYRNSDYDDDGEVKFETEDEFSVPSHDKTPLPQYRANPAIDIQEHMSSISLTKCNGMLERSLTLSRKLSTERCGNYKQSREKVKMLMKHFSDTIREEMPAHAAECQKDVEHPEPEVALVRGILEAGQGDYNKAIKRFKQALKECKPSDPYFQTLDVRLREVRISALHQIGISLCLLGDFAEAERYYQFASEEYGKDLHLLSCNISTYSKLAKSAGTEFLKNSPIEKSLHKLMEELCRDDVDTQDSTSESGSSSNDQSEVDTSINNDPFRSHQSNLPRKHNGTGDDDNNIDNVSTLSKDTLRSLSEPTADKLNIQNNASHSPYIQSTEQSNSSTQSECENTETSSTQRTDNMSWFPSSKEELLDYSAAYIQMMIMGAEMVKHHQHTVSNIPGTSTQPNSLTQHFETSHVPV